MKVYISGIQYGYEPGSLEINEVVNERSTASFVIVHDTTKHFEWHEPVEIQKDDGTTVFTGFIEKPVKRLAGITGPELKTNITCIDNHYLADKRLINEVYTSTTAGAVVTDLITNYLADEGITAGTISAGNDVERAAWNFEPVSSALDALAEKSNYVWYIDKDLALHFIARTDNTAPWTLGWWAIEFEEDKGLDGSRKNYRNRQYIRNCSDQTSAQTESYKGDGETTSFPLGYPVSSVSSVTVNGASKTFDIKGASGAQWYYNPGEATITQDTSETVLTSSDTLSITYVGRFQLVLYADDAAEQTSLASTEGVGTGIVEHVRDDPSMTTIDAAMEQATDLLSVYSQESGILPFVTHQDGLSVGQLLTVNLPELDLNNETFLIESIDVEEYGDKDSTLKYSVRATKGPAGQGWLSFWQSLLRENDLLNKAINIDATAGVWKIFSFSKTWSENETPEMFENPYPETDEYFEADLRPGFTNGEEIVYFAWGDGSPGASALGNELGRKQITKLVSSTGKHFSIVILYAHEANEAITEIGWFGGFRASATADSGVLIEARSWAYTKTSAEVLQIQRTDTKGY